MTKFTGISPYEQRYQVEGYYWGVKPNALAMEVLKLAFPDRPMKLLDIGCGEGRDAVFFARNGFEVTAFDVAEAGLEKGRKLAEACGIHVNFIQADLRTFRTDEVFDVIYSSGVIHHIRPEFRDELMNNLNLAVCQAEYIHSLPTGNPQQIVGGDTEESGDPHQNVKGGITDPVLVFTYHGFGKANLISKLCLGQIAMFAQAFQYFTEVAVIHGCTTFFYIIWHNRYTNH